MSSIQHLTVAGTTYDIEDSTVDTKLLTKANLVNGKVPDTELPAYASLVNGKVPETELPPKADLVNGKVPTTQLPTMGTTVEANPTVTGTENGLTSIKINNINYITSDTTARSGLTTVNNTINSRTAYKATEHKVGTFLGDDMYARTIQFTIPAGATQDYSIANYSTWGIDKIVKFECVSYSNVDNGTTFPTMWYNHNSQSPFGVWSYCSNSQVIISSTSLSSITGGYATVYYTKA